MIKSFSIFAILALASLVLSETTVYFSEKFEGNNKNWSKYYN